MNKSDIISSVNGICGSRREAYNLVNFVFSMISDALTEKDTVTLTGFGTFRVIQRKARRGRNPRTGENLWVESSNVLRFTPCRTLKEAVKKTDGYKKAGYQSA